MWLGPLKFQILHFQFLSFSFNFFVYACGCCVSLLGFPNDLTTTSFVLASEKRITLYKTSLMILLQWTANSFLFVFCACLFMNNWRIFDFFYSTFATNLQETLTNCEPFGISPYKRRKEHYLAYQTTGRFIQPSTNIRTFSVLIFVTPRDDGWEPCKDCRERDI